MANRHGAVVLGGAPFYIVGRPPLLLQLCSQLFAFESQKIRIARMGPAREDQILPVRDKCGAQRRAVHGLPLRLCGTTFGSSGPIYVLASTHYFAVCLTCSRALSTRRCRHIKPFLNRTPSHPVKCEVVLIKFSIPGHPPSLLKYEYTSIWGVYFFKINKGQVWDMAPGEQAPRPRTGTSSVDRHRIRGSARTARCSGKAVP